MAAEKNDPLKPVGRKRFDLSALDPAEFEKLCFRLVRLEFPDAVKPKDTNDGGADGLLLDGLDCVRAWQSKHFPGAIDWRKCIESFESAAANFEMDRYTFCFPRNLTETERKTFAKHFQNPTISTDVDYWNGEEIEIRLTGSSHGERVASHFFADPQTDMSEVVRAIEAGGQLKSHEDVLDRLHPIGEFLAQSDPYFTYTSVVHESDALAPDPAPGSVLSVADISGGITKRVDVAPRDDEALELFGPEGRLLFADDPDGREALKAVGEAIASGRETTVENVTVKFDRLPPGMKSVEGKELTGRLQLGPVAAERRVPAPWKTRMLARSGERVRRLDVELQPTEEPPEGWDVALEGSSGGMTIRVRFRERKGKGEINVTYTYGLGVQAIQTQLDALRFVESLSTSGTLTIRDRARNRKRGTGREDLVLTLEDKELDDEHRALVALLENLREIEKWSGVDFSISEEISPEEVQTIGYLAASIRSKRLPVSFSGAEFEMPDENEKMLEEGGQLAIAQDLTAVVMDQRVPIGQGVLRLDSYRIVDRRAHPERSGVSIVQIEPESTESGKTFQSLSPPKGRIDGTRRPSPRKAKRAGGGRKKRRPHGR